MKKSWLAVLSLLIVSCATITRGVHEKLTVTSDPSGATVQLSSGERGVTPAKFVKARRGENFMVTISKPGYISQTVKVESKGGPTGGTAMAANAVSGGIVGVAVDASTGAYYSFYPNPIFVRLMPEPRATKSRRIAPSAAEHRKSAKSKATESIPKKTSPSSSPSPAPANSPMPEPTPEVQPTVQSSPVLESSPVLQSAPTP